MSHTKKSGFFPYFLGGVILLFIGIMVYVYHGAKAANPVILDEKGQLRGASAPQRP